MRTILSEQVNMILARQGQIYKNLLFGHFVGVENHKATFYRPSQSINLMVI